MSDVTGIQRLRQAIDNQSAAGEACFSLPAGEARAICDECEDELARVSWAQGVPVPVDADGKVVPLTTEVMYDDDGKERKGSICRSFILSRERDRWYFGVLGGSRGVASLHLTRPDSWERLEEDVKRFEDYRDACAYYDRLLDDCDGCPGNEPDCDYFVARDVMRRTKALAGREANGTEQ